MAPEAIVVELIYSVFEKNVMVPISSVCIHLNATTFLLIFHFTYKCIADASHESRI